MIIIITDNISLILVQFDCWQDKQSRHSFDKNSLTKKILLASMNGNSQYNQISNNYNEGFIRERQLHI